MFDDFNNFVPRISHVCVYNADNVFLYQEQDHDFLYIALELCHSTLQDFVEGKYKPGKPLDAVEIMRQTTAGINHLHCLKPKIGNSLHVVDNLFSWCCHV